MSTSFVKRLLKLDVKLAPNPGTNQPNTFAESGTDTVTIEGARMSARVSNSGTPSGAQASVDIWGLTPSLMNQLSTLGLAFNLVAKNTLTISAGDDVNGMTTVFAGTIMAAYADYNSMPSVPFKFECNAGVIDAVAPAVPASFPGPVDVATVMSGFARLLGYGFENNGVTTQLPPSYFSGNVRTQMQACAAAAGINAEVVNGNVLAIWPKGGSRTSVTLVPILSKDSGMIGSPAFTQQGIIVKTVFNPQIAFGGKVQVLSTVLNGIQQAQQAKNQTFKTPSNSIWAVYKLDHALDSLVPKGQWMSSVYGYNPNYPKPIPQA